MNWPEQLNSVNSVENVPDIGKQISRNDPTAINLCSNNYCKKESEK